MARSDVIQTLIPSIASLALAITCVALGATGLLNSRWSRSSVFGWVAAIALVALIYATGMTSISNQDFNSSMWVAQIVQLAVVVLVGLVIAYVSSTAWRKRTFALPSALLSASLVAAVLVAWNIESISGSDEFDLAKTSGGMPRTRPLPLDSVLAQTDLGTPIQLYTRRADDRPDPSAESDLSQRLAGRVIEVSPVDFQYNCHGWTFTGGQYIVLPHDAERVLRDNGYVVVGEPQPDDVIAYFDPATGDLLHTGLVRTTSPDGLVLIESKWGDAGARYLHEPEVQPYSTEFVYYRTARQGHFLAGLNLPGGGRNIAKGSRPDTNSGTEIIEAVDDEPQPPGPMARKLTE